MADLSQLKLPNNQTYNIKDSAAVKSVTWDTTNKKLTKTINGTTTDVVTGETILNGITSNQVTTGLGYTPPHQPMGTASGNIANFEAAGLPLSKLRVAITAQQDLGGYDYPWVGGAGKNKLPLSVSEIKSSNGGANSWTNNSKEISGIVYTILTDSDENVIGIKANGTATANSILYLMSTTAPPIQLDGQSVIISMAGFSKGAYKDNSWHDILAPSTESTVTLNGDVVQMWGQINNGVQVNNIVIQPMIRLASVSDSTYAPYSNICPISGHTEANVTKCGKNLIPYVEFGILNQTDGSEEDNTSNKRTGFIRTLPNTQYTISGLDGSGISIRIFEYKEDKNYIRNYVSSNITNSVTIQTGAEVGYIRFQGNETIFVSNVAQCEKGNQATAYEPYNGTTYTIDLDGTRYGGKLDVVSGVLTVEKASIKLNDLNWTKQNTTSGNWRFISSQSIQNIKLPTDASWKIDNLCSVYQNVTANETWTAEKTGIAINADGKLLIDDLNIADKTELASVIANQTYCYELATPLTYQLSKQQIRSLVGVNNIFASTGEVSVTYVTQEYDGLTANYASEAGGITQTPTTSSDTNEYPLLLKYSNNGSEEANIVKTTRDARFIYKPSQNTLNASYYNGNTLVRKTIYGSAGIRTQGRDSYNRNVNSEYLQEGFNVKYSASLSGGDLTDAGVTCRIDDCGGVDQYQPQIDIYNTRYASASQDSGVSKEGVIDHESIRIFEDYFNDNYAVLSSQQKGFYAYKDGIYLVHQEWSQGSTTPTINEAIQIEIDDITLTGNTWDETHTSLSDAITAIYSSTLCYSASISRGSGWTQRSTSTAFPSSTTGTYLFMIKDSNGTIYSRIPVPAADFAGTTSTRPLIVRSNGTSSDANNIMAYWSSTTKFYTYAGSSSMPTGTFTLVIDYTPLNI